MPMLRSICVAFVLIWVSGPVAAQSPDTHAAAARELLTFLKGEQRMALAVQQIVALQIQRDRRLGQFQPQIQAFVGKYLAWDALEPLIVDEYKLAFTEAELREILAFYRTPAGRKVLRDMDRIIRDVGRSRNAVMQENSAELREAIQTAQRRQGGTKPTSVPAMAPAKERPGQLPPAKPPPAKP